MRFTRTHKHGDAVITTEVVLDDRPKNRGQRQVSMRADMTEPVCVDLFYLDVKDLPEAFQTIGVNDPDSTYGSVGCARGALADVLHAALWDAHRSDWSYREPHT